MCPQRPSSSTVHTLYRRSEFDAYDHLRTEIFDQFVKGVESIQRRLPPLRFDAIKKSINKSLEHFRSSHWFERALGAK